MKDDSPKNYPHEFHFRRGRGGYLFGIFLITVGLIFLLQNLGILGADSWGKFWPILIIALGAAILLSR